MEAYSEFAHVYDLFMDNIPYKEWCDYLVMLLNKYGIQDGLVLELGCGTGNMTEALRKKGYDMIGIDNSEEMLAEAMEKGMEEEEDGGPAALYLCQDMREFELYGTVGAAVSVCDSMNYILDPEDLLKVFKLVNNYLDPKGLFIFDMNTSYKYEQLLAENTIAENRKEGSFIWENYYDKEERVNEYDLTLFIKESEEAEEERFLRFTETHYQRCYSLDIVKQLLQEAGMELVAVYDAYTKNPLREDSEKVTIIARESGK